MRSLRVVRLLPWLSFCAVVLGWGGCADDAGDAPSCNTLVHDALALTAEVEAQVDRSCNRDSDCSALDFRFRCVPGCDGDIYPIAASAEAVLKAEKHSNEERYCQPIEQRRCKLDFPSCAPFDEPLYARCLNSKCELCRSGQCLPVGTLEAVPDPGAGP
jgi:hypothetical protein